VRPEAVVVLLVFGVLGVLGVLAVLGDNPDCYFDSGLEQKHRSDSDSDFLASQTEAGRRQIHHRQTAYRQHLPSSAWPLGPMS
jgi:hypothetical protein